MKKKAIAIGILMVLIIAGGIIAVDAGNDKTGNGAQSGYHYTLNILGKTWDKGDNADTWPIDNPVVKEDNGHRIFVKLNGKTRILLEKGDFGVLDADGTDGIAKFQLPDPGDVVDGSDDQYNEANQEYKVYIRVLSPKGRANITTEYHDGSEWICSTETVELPGSPGKKNFTDVTRELTTIYVDTDDDGKGDVRYKLFDNRLSGVTWAWDYKNLGLRHAQIRFYPV